VSTRSKWPQRVYADGVEPDYRFSFANERTFLAWIRTALALLAAGVALDVVDLSIDDTLQTIGAFLLVGLSLLCVIAAWVRWAASESAMRRSAALPGFGFSIVLCLLLGVMATAMAIALWLRG